MSEDLLVTLINSFQAKRFVGPWICGGLKFCWHDVVLSEISLARNSRAITNRNSPPNEIQNNIEQSSCFFAGVKNFCTANSRMSSFLAVLSRAKDAKCCVSPSECRLMYTSDKIKTENFQGSVKVFSYRQKSLYSSPYPDSFLPL